MLARSVWLNLRLPRGRSDAALEPYLGAGVNVATIWQESGTGMPPAGAPRYLSGSPESSRSSPHACTSSP